MLRLFLKRQFILSFLLITIMQAYAQVKIIAHRGASSIAPENTLAAFTKAIEIMADYIEMDIRMSKDDSIMVIHDEKVNRTSSGSGDVNDMTYKELKKLSVGYTSKFGSKFHNEKIPTLFEVLYLTKDKIKVCIDMKTVSENTVINLIEKMKMTDQVVLLSYNSDKLIRVKSLNDKIEVVLLKNTMTNADIFLACEIGASVIGCSYFSPAFYIDAAHKKDIDIWMGIVNDPAKMETLINKNIVGIITDYPQYLKEITEKDIRVYPNPFRDKVTFEILNPETIRELSVYDLSGRYVTSFSITNTITEWQPGELSQGLYIIYVHTKEKIIFEKILKSN